jgi:selenophosphate synthase
MPKYTARNTSRHVGQITITLDGEQVSKVVEADTDEGYLVRMVTDDRGQVIAGHKEILTERLTGHVEVRFT